jgi:uncharacterized membrane protein
LKVKKQISDYWNSFSFVGLVAAALFFAASVTPSLLPRTYYVQGILSGFAIAVGYSLGVALVLFYQFLELPNPSGRLERNTKFLSSLFVGIVVVVSLRHMAFWQDSIRELMGMMALETVYLYRTAAIALLSGAAMIGLTRLLIRVCAQVSRWLNRLMPRRVSATVSVLLVGFTLFLVGNGLVVRGLLYVADSIFLKADELVEEGIEQPTSDLATGSANSLIDWDTIGRQGKNFIVTGPTQASISEFLGRKAMAPIRVYAGMNSADTPIARAELALRELVRVGAFERSVLVVATPTGTGWLDPGAVDTLEFLHAGDCAIVSTQYSYLPSWLTIAVDPRRSIESADALFDVVYGYWKSLPHTGRPKIYLQGLSLGSLGGEVSADLLTMYEDPIQGAVWSGPPFPSRQWNNLTAHRNSGSPAWLPEFRDGRMVRFTSQKNTLLTEKAWGPIRNVYIQYASDPMVFFSPSLLYQKPQWLSSPRGPDVSPHLAWYPIVTFLQIAFDLPMATSVPHGYGHNYSSSHYIDAWVAVTQPIDWTAEWSERLKSYFREQ